VISSDLSGMIIIWDFEKRQIIHSLHKHTMSVKSLFMLPDNETLGSSSYDGTIRLWNVHEGTEQKALHPRDFSPEIEHESVSAMILLPDRRIISGGRGGYVRVWDLNSW
jgi:WD40 repeat protein